MSNDESAQVGATGSLSITGHAQTQLNANSAEQRKKIRANATTFDSDEWELMDEAVFGPMRENLVLAEALDNANLTFDVEAWQTQVGWKTMGDITDAEVGMDLRTTSEEDKPTFDRQAIPLPFIFKDYRFGYRELEKSRRMGTPLDTAMAQMAGRQVAEGTEEVILNGVPDLQTPSQDTSLSLPGMLNVTGRAQITGSDWATGTNAVSDIKSARNALLNANQTPGAGGYWLLIGTGAYMDFSDDYTAEANQTTGERVESITDVNNVIHVPRMPDGEALLFRPVSEVFDLARLGDGPLNLEWTTHGGAEQHNKVYHVAAPRIKRADAFAHITGV